MTAIAAGLLLGLDYRFPDYDQRGAAPIVQAIAFCAAISVDWFRFRSRITLSCWRHSGRAALIVVAIAASRILVIKH